MAPDTPQRSPRPGQAVARLDLPSLNVRGPDTAPDTPNARRAPAKPWRVSISPR